MSNVQCTACGAEDELYRGGRCWTCELALLVDEVLTDPGTGSVAADMVPLAQALKSMKRSNSGLTWLRQSHVTAFLTRMAAASPLTHEKLDDIPGPDRTRNYIRGLLVEHGVLPRRDELAIRYDRWAATALDRVITTEHREIVRRYVRWYHQRRMNHMDSVPQGTFLRSKQTVTVVIEFLNWLHAHGVSLPDLRQDHLDAWLADGPSTRRFVDRFIPWAITCRIVTPDLSISRHRRGTSVRMTKTDQDTAVDRVIHTTELTTRDRVAAILVLVFGQHIEDVVRMTWSDVMISDETVSVHLGDFDVILPHPLDQPLRKLAASPGHDLTAAHPTSNWIFRGNSPGQHIQGASLRYKLKGIFSTRAARLGTLHEITKLGPIPILAEALGYHPSTIERHAIGSASTYVEYIAAARDQHHDP